MKINHFRVIVLALTLLLAACGSDSGNTEESQPEAQIVPTASEQAEVKGEPFISAPGISDVLLLTDSSGVGAKPLFQWDSVTGASRYQLTVFDEDGKPYWAWEGANTQIYMGGTDTQPPEDSSGPSIEEAYTWTVVAYSSDGKVLAASEVRTISP